MTDNKENVLSESSSGMIESDKLAQILDDMITQAAVKKEEDILIIPENREPEKKSSDSIDEIIVIPQNSYAEERLVPSPESAEDGAEAPQYETADTAETEVLPEEASEDLPEEPSEDLPEEPVDEAVQEPEQVTEEVFAKAESGKEGCLKTPKVKRKSAAAAVDLLNNIDSASSLLTVASPSGREDASLVALLLSMGLSSSKRILLVNGTHSDALNEYFGFAPELNTLYPTDLENLFFISADENTKIDGSDFDTVVYAVDGVNTEFLTPNSGVLLAVKPKVTSYGAYRKALKSLKGSPAKIIGAVIV